MTNNHPYWVVGTGWVEVADLAAGMTLSTSDGPDVNIVSVHDTGVVERTYNLEVADFHTFFVGQEHVLVHNMCKVPDLNIDAAKSASNAVQLEKQLASQAQMGEAGAIMAGASGRTAFRDAGRIAQQYGGNAADWVKKTSSSYASRDGTRFETHWVENIRTGQRVEYKTKFPGGD